MLSSKCIPSMALGGGIVADAATAPDFFCPCASIVAPSAIETKAVSFRYFIGFFLLPKKKLSLHDANAASDPV
jgi:hypothetical protein